MADVDEDTQCNLEDALNTTVAMYIDMFGFSLLMPPVACDLALTTTQRGLLSAMPFIGVMICSYGWGLCVDTLGRRSTLMVAMPTGMLLNLAASLMPNYWSMAVLKFLSGAFTSSANAGAIVLLGESVPQRYRSRVMFVLTTVIMCTQLIVGVFSLTVINFSFRINVPWLGVEYRPWRLLMQIVCLPGVLGCLLCHFFVKESPKFLLSKNRTQEALQVLGTMYSLNTGNMKIYFPVSQVRVPLDSIPVDTKSDTNIYILRKIWNQTAPLFKPPLLRNSSILYYILMCACMTSTGFSIWVPTMTNAYFNKANATGKTFCQVASQSVTSKNSTMTNCDRTIDVNAIYATMTFSVVAALYNIVLSFLVRPFGKKMTTQGTFVVSLVCGFALLFVKIPMLSIALFFMFLYAALILGNVKTYLVELNPTHLRGMAACLSVVVSRGFGFMGVQLIAITMADYCVPMMSGYVLLVGSGLVVSFLLPADAKPIADSTDATTYISTHTEDYSEIKLATSNLNLGIHK